MPRAKTFSREVIRQSLPGCVATIAKRSGYTVDTVRRALVDLLACGQAYQCGWIKPSNYVPTYAAGLAPQGFTLPPKPLGETSAVREARYGATRKGRIKAAALSRASYVRRHDAELERMREYRKANRDTINANRRKRQKLKTNPMLHIVATLIHK